MAWVTNQARQRDRPELLSLDIAALENPPVPVRRPIAGVSEARHAYNPAGLNYLELEAKNQALGGAGKQFVVNFERARLIRAGKDALAERVEQVSATVGPSAGFDIHSYDADGTDRFIEAKTTKHGKNTPFFLTPNELAFSEKNAPRYFLYRVFRFRVEPRLFVLSGRIKDQCTIEPSEYMARLV